MKVILLLALSAIILSQSYGFAYADHGGNHYTAGEVGTITIGTDSSSYTTGEMINVSGSVFDYDELDPFKNFDMTLKLISFYNTPRRTCIIFSAIIFAANS